MDLQYIKFGLTIFISILSSLIGYHKYIMQEVNKKATKKELNEISCELKKKVDKILYEKEIEFLKNQRIDDNKTLFNKMNSIESQLKNMNQNLLEIFKHDKY
ncbi:MAG: hypothetical protein ACTH29_00155 [Fusobacterium sp.]